MNNRVFLGRFVISCDPVRLISWGWNTWAWLWNTWDHSKEISNGKISATYKTNGEKGTF